MPERQSTSTGTRRCRTPRHPRAPVVTYGITQPRFSVRFGGRRRERLRPDRERRPSFGDAIESSRKFAGQPRHRDPVASLHQPQGAPDQGALDHHARPRRQRLRRPGQGIYRRLGWAVVCLARVQRAAAGRSGAAAARDAALLSQLFVQIAWPGDRTGGADTRSPPRHDVEGVLQQFRIGSERHRDQAGLVLQQRAGPAA